MAGRLSRAVAAPLLLALLAGCGVRMDEARPPVASAPVETTAGGFDVRQAEHAVQVKPKPQGKLPPAPAAAPTRQAEAKDVELPVYPGAKLERSQATRAQRNSAVVYLSTPDSVDKVYAWYKAQLAGKKLRDDQLVKDSKANGPAQSAVLTEQVGDGLRQVSIVSGPEGTKVLLVRLRAAGVFKR